MKNLKRLSLKLVLTGTLLAALLVLPLGCGDDNSTNSTQNRAPVINSVTASPSTVNPGGTSTVTVSASDPDGDVLTYTFNAAFGSVTPSGNTATWTLPTNPSPYTITATVSDGKASVQGEAGVTVIPPPTQIVGNLSLPIGTSGDLANTRVAIYTSLQEWQNDTPVKFVAATGSGTVVSYVISNVVPGNYYLDAWKDIDNSATFSVGDFFGWYGSGVYPGGFLTQFSIAQDQTVTLNINMFILQ